MRVMIIMKALKSKKLKSKKLKSKKRTQLQVAKIKTGFKKSLQKKRVSFPFESRNFLQLFLKVVRHF